MRTRRPRFVVALALGAVVVAGYQAAIACLAPAVTKSVWPAVRLGGIAGSAVALLHAGVCALGAWGLWYMRAWGRWIGMLYIGALIASFLLWGLSEGEEDVVTIMAWQVFVLPLLTFGFMYLQRGARYFGTR